MHSPPWWEDEEAELPFLESDLRPPLELGPDVEHSFQEPCGEDEGSHFSSEPPVEEFESWVEWRGQAVDTLSWWQEPRKILEVGNFQELAQKMWAPPKDEQDIWH